MALIFLAACAPLAAPDSTAAPSPSPTAAGPTGTVTPTIDWFPATATATLAPTPVFTPTPDQRPGRGGIVLEDTFSDPQPWQSGKLPAGNIAFGDHELTLAVAAPKGALTSLRAAPDVGDAYVEVTATPSLCRGGDAYGLLLRATSTPNFYRFLLSCDGKLRLDRVKNGSALVLQDWTPYIGPPQPTHLGVWMAGGDLRFFVDDRYQFSVRDPVLTTGSLGLFARAAGDTALTVSFSNLIIRKLEQ